MKISVHVIYRQYIFQHTEQSFSCRWLFCRQPCCDDGCRPPAGGLSQLHHQPAVPVALLQTRNTPAQLWLAPGRYTNINTTKYMFSISAPDSLLFFSRNFLIQQLPLSALTQLRCCFLLTDVQRSWALCSPSSLSGW